MEEVPFIWYSLAHEVNANKDIIGIKSLNIVSTNSLFFYKGKFTTIIRRAEKFYYYLNQIEVY